MGIGQLLYDISAIIALYPVNLIPCHVGIDKITDHSLIRHMITLCYFLKKSNRFNIQRHRYLDAFSFKNKLIRRRQKVFNDLEISYWSISVLDAFLHKLSFLSARNRPQISVSFCFDK